MTTPLFPDEVIARRPPPPADSNPGPVGRWSLHRAGIVNVWQYDRVELELAGGRALLRGRNGAGKSKALEVLLPFLFDGDVRYLDATGRDRTTVRWLMTEGRPGGNHVGYVWLELRCLDDEGEATFLSLGAGLKASTTAQRTDSWFFMTDRRVGVDFDLEAGGECLSLERLKAAVGEESVTPSGAEHRRRVGRHLFGLFDDARYRNLLHLLHRLRDPNIGNRVEAGELASVLSDALPPIDERVLTESAGHFDDLDTIKGQVEHASKTAAALGDFLASYRGYTRMVLARRATAVAEAGTVRARSERDARRLAVKVDDTERGAREAQSELHELRAERRRRGAERVELERSDAYRAHLDLTDRTARVDALDKAASAAEEAARRAELAHRRAVDESAAAAADLRRAVRAAAEVATAASALAPDAGFDPNLLGGGLTVRPDGELDAADLAGAHDRSRSARRLVQARQARARVVRGLAQHAEDLERVARVAEDRAAASESDVETRRAEVASARSGSHAAATAWSESVTAWMKSTESVAVAISWSEVVGRLAMRGADGVWTKSVREAVADALAPVTLAARRAAAQAEVDVSRAEASLALVRDRCAEVEAETEARPIAARCRDHARDPAAGAAFYELVDLAPRLDEGAGAGIEAALEASGLLDAWVQADGLVVHPDTRDVLLDCLSPQLDDGAATLANVLVPSPQANSAVSVATVSAVLQAIGLGEQPDRHTWVTTGGRWSLGVLHGAWHKEHVEFLGAGARRATRERVLDQLRVEMESAREVMRRARASAGDMARRLREIEALPGSVPSDDAVLETHRDLALSERELAGARGRYEDDRRQAERARGAANRAAVNVAHEASADALPTGTDALDLVLDRLADLREAVAEHERHFGELTGANDRFHRLRGAEEACRAEASDCQQAAQVRRREHAEADHALATLRLAIASSVDAVLAEHHAVVERLSLLEEQLVPAAERAQQAAGEAWALARAQLGTATEAAAKAAGDLAAAGSSLANAVNLPGVFLAATGRDTGGLPDAVSDPVAFGVAVAALVEGGEAVSDGAILARYDRLSEALASGFDSVIDEHDGVKVVSIADESGRQPLATVARRLADEAEAAKARLATREREVLERFLLRELADEVRTKMLDAHDLITGTNRTLAGVRTSHGKGAHLEWRLRDDAAAPAAVASRLLVDQLRDESSDGELRDALLSLIEAERAADPSAGYEQHLRAALDYRSWHRFTVKVTDSAQPGSTRTLSSRLGLSQGEQRVVSYLALFAAAAAHFEAIARQAPATPRLLLLDDAFAKVDEPTHAELLGLLVRLGLDFVLTSERMWGCFESVPSLDIYEAVRDPAHRGVALVHFRWDGRQRRLVGV